MGSAPMGSAGDLLGVGVGAGLDAELAARGFTEDERVAVFGGNFRRVAEQVWRG